MTICPFKTSNIRRAHCTATFSMQNPNQIVRKPKTTEKTFSPYTLINFYIGNKLGKIIVVSIVTRIANDLTKPSVHNQYQLWCKSLTKFEIEKNYLIGNIKRWQTFSCLVKTLKGCQLIPAQLVAQGCIASQVQSGIIALAQNQSPTRQLLCELSKHQPLLACFCFCFF